MASRSGDRVPGPAPSERLIGYVKWAAALRPIFATLRPDGHGAGHFTLEEGFESLFNGTDLTGWGLSADDATPTRTSAKRWQATDPNAAAWPFVTEPRRLRRPDRRRPDGRFVVINGRLVVTTPPEGRQIQQLWTTREFGEDFMLKLEFRATPNADSGVYVRGPQLQCRDYALAGPYKNLKKLQAAGLERAGGHGTERRRDARPATASCSTSS